MTQQRLLFGELRLPYSQPVEQVIGPEPGKWEIGLETGRRWLRDDAGTLWVWCLWWDTRRTRRTGSYYMRMWGPQAAPVPEWEDRRHPHRTYPGSVHPSRITAALDIWGMDGPEVDEALGVATPDDHVVDAWETGDLVPSHTEVLRLATLTGFGPKWFYGPAMPATSPAWFCGDDGCELRPGRTLAQ